MKAIVKLASAAALAAASIGSAQAATYIFNFSGNDNSQTYGAPGNSISQTSSNGSISVSVTATAWSLVNNVLGAGFLGNYPEGLGVKNSAGDQNSVDNYQGLDFVLLQFSRPVSLTSAYLTPKGYPVFQQSVRDADALFSYGSTAAASDGSINSPVPGNFDFLRPVAVNGETGLFWKVAANGADRTFDAFKISQITVSAVPEPATWALMILGFGAIGFAMRNRRATVSKVSYAI